MLTLLLAMTALAQDAPPEAPDVEPEGEPVATQAPACAPAEPWQPGTVAGNEEAVAALEAYAFAADWEDPERAGVRTDAVVILKGNEIVYERYDNGTSAYGVHLGWSMTKTLTAMLAGIAVEQGVVSLDTSVCEHIDGLPEASCAVTLGHLLDFGSNFDWLETYEGQSPTASSVLAMLYGEGEDGMGAFVASHPLRGEPGGAYMYSSGDTNVIATMLHAALSPTAGDDWPEELLLRKAGVEGATWERDGAGVPVGSSYLWASARDFARLGVILRDDGCARGERVVPADWVAWMGEVNDPIRTAAYDRWTDNVQGRQLWLNRPLPEHNLPERPWPRVPDDAVAMLGHWGQSVLAIPSKDLVIVRLADDRDKSFSRDRFWALALAVAGEGPVPAAGGDPERGPVGEPSPIPGRTYDTGLLKIATRFAAKEACSCTFVAQRPEAWCRAWLKVSPDVAKWKVGDDGTVTAKALGMARSTARVVGPGRGCEIVE